MMSEDSDKIVRMHKTLSHVWVRGIAVFIEYIFFLISLKPKK